MSAPGASGLKHWLEGRVESWREIDRLLTKPAKARDLDEARRKAGQRPLGGEITGGGEGDCVFAVLLPSADLDSIAEMRRLTAARKSSRCFAASCSCCSSRWKCSQPSSVMRSPLNMRLLPPPPPCASPPPDAGDGSERVWACAYFWKSEQKCGRSNSRSSRLACTCEESTRRARTWTHGHVRCNTVGLR